MIEINGSSIAGNGFQTVLISANGIATRDTLSYGYKVPNSGIWNSYAAMFDFYQVERVDVEFYPFHFKLTPSTAGVNAMNARPVLSCLDPESTVPGTPSAIASYGNMKVSPPEAVHHRSMLYHDLGMQKQDTIILATNG